MIDDNTNFEYNFTKNYSLIIILIPINGQLLINQERFAISLLIFLRD